MNDGPDDLKWLAESKMLGLCHLPRSILNSWKRAGIDLANDNGAYGLDETISVFLLGAARDHIKPKEMAGAWRELVGSGAHAEIVRKARELEGCERFDLIVDAEYATLGVATSDAELIDAVCHPNWPRPVVVIDVAEAIASIVRAFDKVGNTMARPVRKQPGRPRNVARLHAVGKGSGR